jgi:tetratricopeptide (TPR) repeat protein
MRRLALFLATFLQGAGLFMTPASAGYFQDNDVCSSERGRPEAAIAACTRLINAGIWRGHKLGVFHHNRAFWYSKIGDFDHALQDDSLAIKFGAATDGAYNNRCWARLNAGDIDGAFSDCNEAIRRNSKNADAYDSRCAVWLAKGEPDRAISDCNTSIRLAPKSIGSFSSRGLAYESKGDTLHARADFETALKLLPEHNPNRPAHSDDKKAQATAREHLAALADSAAPAARPTLVAATPPLAPTVAPTPMSQPAAAPQATIASTTTAIATLPAKPPANAPAVMQPRRRVALVIGNGSYMKAPALENPVNDARDMAGALRSLGFKVIEGYDLDSTAMRHKIEDFGRLMPGAATTLFYYAGHGLQVAGKNYVVPVDARLEHPSALGTETIEVGTVLADMETEKRTNLVFLDACRDNPLSRTLARSFNGTRSLVVGSGLAPLNAGIGTLIAFATSPGTVALDGDGGRNSPFTKALLKHIRTPNLEVRSMLTRVRADVIAMTQEQQVPWDHSSLTGEFYFVPAVTAAGRDR